MSRQRILEEWNNFRSNVLPAPVAEAHGVHMRRAFFAGAVACFDIVSRNAAELPEADAYKVFDELSAEFVHFAEQIKKGVG